LSYFPPHLLFYCPCPFVLLYGVALKSSVILTPHCHPFLSLHSFPISEVVFYRESPSQGPLVSPPYRLGSVFPTQYFCHRPVISTWRFLPFTFSLSHLLSPPLLFWFRDGLRGLWARASLPFRRLRSARSTTGRRSRPLDAFLLKRGTKGYGSRSSLFLFQLSSSFSLSFSHRSCPSSSPY